MKFNEKLIKQLTNGEIAVENDFKNNDLLKSILNEAFPNEKDKCCNGCRKFYQIYGISQYIGLDRSSYSSIPIKDFIEEEIEEQIMNRNTEWMLDWTERNKEAFTIDYTIKGTKLPDIPIGTDFKIYKSQQLVKNTISKLRDLISFGKEIINNEIWIKADSINYIGNNFYLLKLSDLNNLTNNQMKEIDLRKDKYVVECRDINESTKVLNFIKNRTNDKWRCSYCINHLGDLDKDIQNNNYHYLIPKDCKDYPLLQFKEWEKLYNKQYNKMEKKIIGYKLIKEEYKVAVNSILDSIGNVLNYNNITVDPSTHNLLKQAGVLELWFTPIFQEEEIIVSMNGQFDLKINQDGIWHKSENIVEYVQLVNQDIIKVIEDLPKKLCGYDILLEVGEILTFKTGCEEKQTKLSNWKIVWEQYQKLINNN